MTTVRLTCDERGCKAKLQVEVRDEYGPWRGADKANLYDAASRAGWLAEVASDGYANHYCPEHNAAAVR